MYVIAGILILMWIGGNVLAFTLSGLIHVLLVVAVVLIAINVFKALKHG